MLRQKGKKRRAILALLCLAFLLSACTEDNISVTGTEESFSKVSEVVIADSEEPVQEEPSTESEDSEDISSSAEESTEILFENEKTDKIDLIMVGDMLMHLRVTQSGKMEDGTYNYDHFFAHVSDEISDADLALVNQEIMLGGEELGFSGYPIFNTAYEVADALNTAGFDACLQATNHAMDKGKSGLMNCMGYWEENYPDMEVLGIHDTEEDSKEIYVYEQNGIKIAILNYTYGLNGMPLPADMPYAVDLLKEDKVREDIQRAKEISDFVIVCPHWGTEYRLTASEEQKRYSQIFLEEGVDLVIGTHPHVIEPVEWLEDEDGNRMLVYYSLGNFINSTASEGSGVARRVVGAMAKVRIERDSQGDVVISEYGVEPLVTQIISGVGQMTTYKLSDYNEELAKTNEILRRDSSFSYQYCIDLCDEVFGDLADGEMEPVTMD